MSPAHVEAGRSIRDAVVNKVGRGSGQTNRLKPLKNLQEYAAI